MLYRDYDGSKFLIPCKVKSRLMVTLLWEADDPKSAKHTQQCVLGFRV